MDPNQNQTTISQPIQTPNPLPQAVIPMTPEPGVPDSSQNKKKLFILLVLLILVVIVAAVVFMLMRKQTIPPVSQQTTTTTTTTTTQVVPATPSPEITQTPEQAIQEVNIASPDTAMQEINTDVGQL